MDVSQEVKQIIARALKTEPDKLSVDTELTELGLGSLEVIEMVFDLEEKFDINISFEQGENSMIATVQTPKGKEQAAFNTVGEVIGAVQRIVDMKAA